MRDTVSAANSLEVRSSSKFRAVFATSESRSRRVAGLARRKTFTSDLIPKNHQIAAKYLGYPIPVVAPTCHPDDACVQFYATSKSVQGYNLFIVCFTWMYESKGFRVLLIILCA